MRGWTEPRLPSACGPAEEEKAGGPAEVEKADGPAEGVKAGGSTEGVKAGGSTEGVKAGGGGFCHIIVHVNRICGVLSLPLLE